MSAYIQAEIELAAHSFLLGIVLMVSYDGLRLWRFFIPHKNIWTGLEDFLYWLYAACLTFSLLFKENSGRLRGYVIICVFLGMYLYDRVVSRTTFGLLKKLQRWITIKISRWKTKRERRRRGRKAQ